MDIIFQLADKQKAWHIINCVMPFGGSGWIRTTEAIMQQIYSLSPLATRERSHIWSWWTESNHKPADYKSAALPLSHTSIFTERIILYHYSARLSRAFWDFLLFMFYAKIRSYISSIITIITNIKMSHDKKCIGEMRVYALHRRTRLWSIRYW